jgi:hypothetical protein
MGFDPKRGTAKGRATATKFGCIVAEVTEQFTHPDKG